MDKELDFLKQKDRTIKALHSAAAVLGWDQETYMPDKAIGHRSDQLAAISVYLHEIKCDPRIAESAERLSGSRNIDEIDAAYVREMRRLHQKAVKLPSEFVERKSRQQTVSQSVWAKSRKDSDFASFAPYLQTLVDLALEEAEFYGYENTPYDALVDLYEPYTKSSEIGDVFAGLKSSLTPLLERISQAPQVSDAILHREYSVKAQKQFGNQVLEAIGFEFDRGRLDDSVHPFTTELGPDDVRITARYDPHFFNSGIFSIIHEGGHALYELGPAERIKGTILGGGTSLGVHESQSRFWENMVGRSLEFWEFYLPELRKYFPESMKDVGVMDLYKAVNKVEPSLIRVEADEVSYSLHVIQRFEIEKDLIEGRVKVSDLPDIWNAKSAALLGLEPQKDAEGVLQDIHWSMGAFGYFPTYALGNLYAAQFHDAMKKQLDVKALVGSGNLTPILEWLRKNIHEHGAVYPARLLCEKVTGKPLSPQYFQEYLEEKYSSIYKLD